MSLSYRSEIKKNNSGVLFAALLVLLAQPARAQWELIRRAGAASCVVENSAGEYRTSYTVGEPSASLSKLGAYPASVLSGYLSQIPSNTLLFSILNFESTGAVVSEGALLGAGAGNPVKFLFSNEVSTEALTAGVAVSKVRDHFGEPVNSTRAVSVALIPDETAVLLNSTASWDKGSVYAVRYSSTLADINGIALGAESTHYFTVKMDYLASNVAVPMNGSGPSVTVPPGAYSSDYYVVVTTAQTSLAVEAANRKLSAMPGAAASVLSVLNVLVYDASGNAVQPSSSCVLTFLYADADGDGIVDGSFPPVRVKDLTVWRLDETNYLWVRQAGADINALAMEASLEVPHLSSYALMAVPDTNVSSVYAYPVPFSPNAGNTARYGDWTGLITFTNLPAFGKIRIYTITGDRVRELDVVPPSMKWDVRNSGGEIVASGVYVWEIVSGTNRKTGKLMVVK